jgi:hypothetical protein
MKWVSVTGGQMLTLILPKSVTTYSFRLGMCLLMVHLPVELLEKLLADELEPAIRIVLADPEHLIVRERVLTVLVKEFVDTGNDTALFVIGATDD